jgi:outer membrane protein assembly factor BamA
MVRLLYASGRFSDVIVEAHGSDAAPELVVRLLPAPLLLDVRVSGSDLLDPGEVRSLARLQDGEPLWRARLDRAARDVALALSDDGYLEARVEASAEPRSGGADAHFEVEAGPRAYVKGLRVDAPGLDAAHQQRLLRLARPRRGEVFRRPAAVEATAELERALAAEGRWRARVDLVESYDPTLGRVDLSFAVEAGPLMRIEILGAEVPGGVRSRLEAIMLEGEAGADAVAECIDTLEEHLRARGFRDTIVRTQEREVLARTVIEFEASQGPRATIASVSLSGAGELAPRLQPIAAIVAGVPLVETRLNAVSSRLRAALHQGGYPDAEVRFEAPEGGGPVPVVFRVEPGPAVTLADVVVEGATADGPQPSLPLAVGQPYRLSDVALARDALLAAWRDAGHLQAEVEPRVERSDDGTEVRVTLRLAPGPLVRIDRIVVAGLEQTRETVVRRELRLEEGGPLGVQNLLETQRRLSALGIFQQVSVRELDPARTGRRSVVVTATEAPRTVLSYGAGYSERDLLRASFEVTRRNLFGMARSVTAFTRIGFRGSRFLATYREPWFLGRRRELFVTAFREEEDREGFDFTRFGGLVQSARNLGPNWSLIGRYSYRQTRVADIQLPPEDIDREFTDSTFSGPSLSLIRDTRDDPLNPGAGSFLGADAQLSADVLGGDSFVKSFVQMAAYRRLGSRLVLAGSGRVGLSATFGSGPGQLPLPDRFFAGGAYSLRGFPVDGVADAGGNALLLGSLELRIPILGALWTAPFADVGNLYPLVGDVDLADLRYSAGLGLRYQSPFGPLRIDWAYKLDRREGESRFRFHFAVGHAF